MLMLATPMSPSAVVLIDDDEAVREALTFSLESAGMVVIPFADGEAALSSELPSDALWVIDERLPGLTGLEVFERLRGRGDRNPALFITSHPKPHFRRAAALGGVDIIEKPLLGDALLHALRNLDGSAA